LILYPGQDLIKGSIALRIAEHSGGDWAHPLKLECPRTFQTAWKIPAVAHSPTLLQVNYPYIHIAKKISLEDASPEEIYNG